MELPGDEATKYMYIHTLCFHNKLITYTYMCMCYNCKLEERFLSLPLSLSLSLSLTPSLPPSLPLPPSPQELGNLRNLRFLELSENHLMLLPDTIGQLANLTDLYLNDNLLTFLPESLGDLHNLQILRLDNNRLGHLPETLDG